MLGGPIVTAGGVISSRGRWTTTSGRSTFATAGSSGRIGLSGRGAIHADDEAGGKQYVVTVDGGHGSFGTKLGDYVRAYALP